MPRRPGGLYVDKKCPQPVHGRGAVAGLSEEMAPWKYRDSPGHGPWWGLGEIIRVKVKCHITEDSGLVTGESFSTDRPGSDFGTALITPSLSRRVSANLCPAGLMGHTWHPNCPWKYLPLPQCHKNSVCSDRL